MFYRYELEVRKLGLQKVTSNGQPAYAIFLLAPYSKRFRSYIDRTTVPLLLAILKVIPRTCHCCCRILHSLLLDNIPLPYYRSIAASTESRGLPLPSSKSLLLCTHYCGRSLQRIRRRYEVQTQPWKIASKESYQGLRKMFYAS
jgi:hypothetical protein